MRIIVLDQTLNTRESGYLLIENFDSDTLSSLLVDSLVDDGKGSSSKLILKLVEVLNRLVLVVHQHF